MEGITGESSGRRRQMLCDRERDVVLKVSLNGRDVLWHWIGRVNIKGFVRVWSHNQCLGVPGKAWQPCQDQRHVPGMDQTAAAKKTGKIWLNLGIDTLVWLDCPLQGPPYVVLKLSRHQPIKVGSSKKAPLKYAQSSNRCRLMRPSSGSGRIRLQRLESARPLLIHLRQP